MKLHYTRSLALSVVALLASAPAALALDAGDFANKLKAVYSTSLPAGSTITFGPATVAGNDITYNGVTLKMPGTEQDPLAFNTQLKFSGVTEQPDGSYLADALSFPDVDYKYEGGELTAKNPTLKHIFVSNSKTPDFLDSSRLFGDASVGPIVLSVDGVPALTVDSVAFSNGFKPSQNEGALTEIDSTGGTSGLKIDVSQAKDADTVAQAKALDLTTITGKVLEAVTWTLKDGHINVSEASVDFDKVGKVKFALDMTGYTPEFLHTLGTMSQSLAQAGTAGGGDQSQAQTAMLLASLQTLFLNSTSLRFDDASITNKLLDMVAKQSNVTRAAFIDQLVASIPAQMNEGEANPLPQQFVQTMQAAVRAYLTDPKSIEVRLAPKTPLGVLGIVAAAMQPAVIVDQIGLKILVDDKEITPADAAKETGVAAPASSDGSTAAPSTDDNSAPADNSDSTSTDNSDQTPAATDDGSDSTDNSSGDRLSNEHKH